MTIRTRLSHLFGCMALAALFAAPALAQDEAQAEHKEQHDVPKVGTVLLLPTQGNNVRGLLRLTQQGEDLHITGRVRNLTPGEHGFHIHEYGDLRSADGTSAGGHFNPHGHEHGAPNEMSHVGDLGNITADENGVARVDKVAKGTPLHFVLGRGFVVHAGKDDLTSQPSGDAGPRVAVGVIGVANPELQTRNQGDQDNQGQNNQGN